MMNPLIGQLTVIDVMVGEKMHGPSMLMITNHNIIYIEKHKFMIKIKLNT